MNNNFSDFDDASTVLYANLYTVSKENREIELKNFNPKDITHLYLLNIANSLSKMYGWPIYINLNLIKRINFFFKGNRISYKHRKKLKTEYECNQLIHDAFMYYGPKDRFNEDIKKVLGVKE